MDVYQTIAYRWFKTTVMEKGTKIEEERRRRGRTIIN